MEDVASRKAAIRAQVLSSISGIPPMIRAQEEDLVNAAIVADPIWQEAASVAVYKAAGHELSVVSATNAAWRAGKAVAFPRVAGRGLVLHRVDAWTGLGPGYAGIAEPDAAAPVMDPADVDVVLVPAVAVTRAGARLGRGGGHYDGLLPAIGGAAWAPVFHAQVVADLPVERHDVPVDRVIPPSVSPM